MFALLRRLRRVVAIIGVATAGGVVALIVLAALFLTSFPHWGVRDADMERWMRADLPRGSSEARIRTFLRAHRVPDDEIEGGGAGEDLHVEFQNRADSIACTRALVINFHLDQDARLIGYDFGDTEICV